MASVSHSNSNIPANINGFHYEQEEENITELQEDWGDEFNDVVTFLAGLHLTEYIETFVNQGINWEIFLSLNEDDLCHIGMTNSKHRALLLQGISGWNKTKRPADFQMTSLKPEEVDSIIANTVKHLTVMHASLAHLRLNLQSPGTHNTLINLNFTSAELLELLTAEADIQAQLVTNQVNALLAKKPGADPAVSASTWKHNLSLISGIGIVCALIFYAKTHILGMFQKT